MKNKNSSKYVCQDCGGISPQWLGKCPVCGKFGTLVEEIEENVSAFGKSEKLVTVNPTPLNDIKYETFKRVSSGIAEFDTVLGGGIVPYSIILLGGDPGIGKSTVLTQISGELAKQNKVLYVSAEESLSQVKLRCDRLGINSNNLMVLNECRLEAVESACEDFNYIIIDSIQAVYLSELQSSAGSVTQVRECASKLMRLAKNKRKTIFIVGHVTKDGNIAGPKVLEHMVDTVIHFEGDKYKSYRILRSIKNRFGNTSEVGIFEMHTLGLKEVKNPNELFLNERSQISTPGSAIIVTNEGTRPLLVEIQALVGTTSYPTPRRVTNGIDMSRLHQILAVLEKRVGLNLSKQDVYVNVMGGIEVDEPSADLGIALAIATCANDIVVDSQTVIIGEIGLSGEIHPVDNIEKRLNEAIASGFKKAIIPFANKIESDKIEIVPVKKHMDAKKFSTYIFKLLYKGLNSNIFDNIS